MRQLTKYQANIARLIAKGMSNRQIGLRLALSEGTVKAHVHQILLRTDSISRGALAAKLHRAELATIKSTK